VISLEEEPVDHLESSLPIPTSVSMTESLELEEVARPRREELADPIGEPWSPRMKLPLKAGTSKGRRKRRLSPPMPLLLKINPLSPPKLPLLLMLLLPKDRRMKKRKISLSPSTNGEQRTKPKWPLSQLLDKLEKESMTLPGQNLSP